MSLKSEHTYEQAGKRQIIRSIIKRLDEAQGGVIRKQPDTIIVKQAWFMAKIVESRKAQHITQVQLAKMVGTSQAAIARIEAGNVNPSLSLVFKIATALNLVISLH